MSKKFLCLILSLALVLSTCIIPAMGETAALPAEIYSNDFESGFNFTNTTNLDVRASLEEGVEANGNKYQVIIGNAANSVQALDLDQNPVLTNSVITFDAYCYNNSAPITFYSDTWSSSGQTTLTQLVLSFGIKDGEVGNWYTYKIEVGYYTGMQLTNDHTNCVKVYRKARGAADSAYVGPLTGEYNTKWSKTVSSDYVYYGSTGSSWSKTGIGYLFHSSKITEANKGNAKYAVDNFAILRQASQAISTGTAFEDGDGNNVSALPLEDSVVPVFKTRSGATAPAFAVTAAYDEDDNLLYVDDTNVSIPTGIARVKAPSVDLDVVENVSRIEAFLWDAENTMKPFTGVAILGAGSNAAESNATELKYSVKANVITVEGKYDGNKAVTLKAVDDSSNIVYVTQFKTTTDGSFSKNIPINYTGNSVSVYLLPEGGTSETISDIVVPTGWAAFKNDFKSLTKGNADSFFTTYADNFKNNDNGTVSNIPELSGLDTDDKSNIGCVINKKITDDSTYYDEFTYS